MTVAEKSIRIVDVMRQVLASEKRPSEEEVLIVLAWIKQGTGEEFADLEEWLSSGPNQMALKTVARFLQDGDTTPFALDEEDEKEEEVATGQAESGGWVPIVINDSDIDASRLFGDKATYIQELVNNHTRPMYDLHQKEMEAWDREKQHMMAAAKLSKRRPAVDGEEVEIEGLMISKAMLAGQ